MKNKHALRSLPVPLPKSPEIRQSIIMRQPKITRSSNFVREKKPFPWRPIIRIALAGALSALLVWLITSPLFLVRRIEVSGLQNVPEQAVRDTIPNQANIWLFPTSRVAQKIRDISPLVADVAIYRTLPDTIRIVVAERVQAIDWQSNSKDYVLGLDGTIILSDPKNVSLLRVVDTTNLEPVQGKPIVFAGFIQFVTKLNQQYPTIFASQIDHLEVGDTVFDVTLVPKSGPKLILDSTRSSDVQLKAAKTVYDKFKDGIKQYIDMRVPERAYYQ